MNSQAEPIFQFIFDLELRIETIIAFKALISYCKNGEWRQVNSEIQVVVLANEVVVYIIEFQKSYYRIEDRYSTADYIFSYKQQRPLQVYANDTLLLSISSAD